MIDFKKIDFKNKKVQKVTYWIVAGVLAFLYLSSNDSQVRQFFSSLLVVTIFAGAAVLIVKSLFNPPTSRDDKVTKALAQLQEEELAEPLPSRNETIQIPASATSPDEVLAGVPRVTNSDQRKTTDNTRFGLTTTPKNAPAAPQRPRAMIYDIAVPKDAKWLPERALELIEHLLTITSGTALLRVVATHNEVKWQVVDYLVETDNTASLIRGIRSIYQEAEVTAAPYTPPNLHRTIPPMHHAVCAYTTR